MRVLITGGQGLLAGELARQLRAAHEVEAPESARLDVRDLPLFQRVARAFEPDVIFHTAAVTNVDACEEEPEKAFRTNAVGSRNAALVAETRGARLVVVSTDFVFDGSASEPYHEFDEPNPINVYGRSKLAGEELVRTFCRRHFIVRTAWLYGAGGKNFLSNLPRLLDEKESLSIVRGTQGSPTYAPDLAEALIQLVQTESYGTHHLVNEGTMSWMEIASLLRKLAGAETDFQNTTFEDLGLPARRPGYTPLTTYMDGPTLRPCEEALKAFWEKLSRS